MFMTLGVSPDRTNVVGFWHAGVTVCDLERSLRFYRDGLGLEVIQQGLTEGDFRWQIWALEADDAKVAFLRIPGSTAIVELFEFVGIERHPASARPCDYGGGHFCLFVDDADAAWRRLCDHGFQARSDGPVTVDSGPHRGIKVLYAVDPDGYNVELYQRQAPAGRHD
jgi:lactoylglutathione lyase